MNFQVESLKVLVTRQVVMNRMDYSTYLNGTVKDELDRLDRLEGKYRIQGSKLTIEGLHQDDWEYFKECLGNRVPMGLVNVIEGKEGFTISESKNGQRTWIISDVDGWKNRELLKSRGYLKLQRSGRHPTWNHFDYFIEDGWLVNTQKGWDHQDYHDMLNGKNGIIPKPPRLHHRQQQRECLKDLYVECPKPRSQGHKGHVGYQSA